MINGRTEQTNSQSSTRRYDLDWLRVLAVLLLVPFHSALVFSLDPGDIVYVKDQVESPILVQFAYFLDIWHMPLLFFISGAGTWFALQVRKGRQYLEERFIRLVVPMLFAITVIVPLMIYVQFWDTTQFDSFWQFYAQFFFINVDDLSGYSGTFTPSHMWFVLFLLVFSLVALPMFLYFKGPHGKRLISRLASFSERPGVLFSLALVPALTALLPDLGGKGPFLYVVYFIYGYILMADARFQQTMDRQKWAALAVGVITAIAVPLLLNANVSIVLIHILYYLGRWCWIVAFVGLGHAYLNSNSSLLRYASEASYPFYILHFLINTIVAYYVVRWNTPIAIKYLAITIITIPTILAVYEVLVKRTNVTRFLFGMKPKRKVKSQARTDLKPISDCQ
ncbi:MAG: acyltransferase family protein [Anaerolineae bacterium]|nr:acyltransferase family protein [Anaerolineae bacterium]